MQYLLSYTCDMTEYELNKKNILNTKMLMIEHDSGYISPEDERNKQFINEVRNIESGKLTIVEPLVVHVVLQKYGVLNRNGRIYPKEILVRQNEVYQEAIRERRALGECDHPESSVISADRVSHNITKTWWEGNTLMGTMEILMSPGFIKSGIVSTKGDDVANLLRHGIKIGVSSRGIGSLAKDKTGNLVVQEDFELICWDVVTAPSTPGAWITPPSQHSKLSENEIKPTNLLNDNLDKFLID